MELCFCSTIRFHGVMINVAQGYKPNQNVVKCRLVKLKFEEVKCIWLKWSEV
jgi:hypothetical protein